MIHKTKHTPKKNTLVPYVRDYSLTFAALILCTLSLLFISRIVGSILLQQKQVLPIGLTELIISGFGNDCKLWLWFSGGLYLLFLVLSLIKKSVGFAVSVALCYLFIFSNLALDQYFANTLMPLGKDVMAYTWSEINQTVQASGALNWISITALVLISVTVIFLLWRSLKVSLFTFFNYLPLGILLALLFASPTILPSREEHPDESKRNLISNKSAYFIAEVFLDKPIEEEPFFLADISAKTGITLQPNWNTSAEYPFLHTDSTKDVLGAILDSVEQPNIVFIIVESLGKAYSGKDAYLGSFTPFLDSLAQHSLYFYNFTSTAGRTFAALPSMLASAPFGKQGFLEMGPQLPQHLSLFSILKKNGYTTNFFYGGDATFDKMNYFLSNNAVDRIVDKKQFGKGYSQLPSENGFSWGFGDFDLYKRSFETMAKEQGPYCSIYLTVTSHSPFLIPRQAYYNQQVLERVKALQLDNNQNQYSKYLAQYASILYVDDAFRYFFKEYAKRPDFNKTIFIITGDHRMPEIPIASQVDRFHVPLLIYSPLLKKSKAIRSINSQFDLTPTLAAYLKGKGMTVPTETPWIGTGLDTSALFEGNKTYPLMRNKNQLEDFLYKDYFLSDGQLYKLSDNMGADPMNEDPIKPTVTSLFQSFETANKKACENNKLYK